MDAMAPRTVKICNATRMFPGPANIVNSDFSADLARERKCQYIYEASVYHDVAAG